MHGRCGGFYAANDYSVTDLPGGFFDVDHPLTTAPSAWPTLDVLFVPHDRSASGSVSGIVLFTATSERSI